MNKTPLVFVTLSEFFDQKFSWYNLGIKVYNGNPISNSWMNLLLCLIQIVLLVLIFDILAGSHTLFCTLVTNPIITTCLKPS